MQARLPSGPQLTSTLAYINMKAIKFIITGFLIVLLGIAGFFYFAWKTGDSITRAGIVTDFLLLKHKFIDQTPEFENWLREYHGEAPSHQVIISFTIWGISNPSEFSRLLSKANDPAKFPSIAERVAFAIYDAGMEKDFLDKFQKIETQELKTIRCKLAEIGKLSEG